MDNPSEGVSWYGFLGFLVVGLDFVSWSEVGAILFDLRLDSIAAPRYTVYWQHVTGRATVPDKHGEQSSIPSTGAT